ncbi:hypothetical protein Tco_1448261 [Tanacetum coccineum]
MLATGDLQKWSLGYYDSLIQRQMVDALRSEFSQEEIYSTVDACQTAQENVGSHREVYNRATRYKGIRDSQPIHTFLSESASEEDSDHEQAQKTKIINKNVDTNPRYKTDNQTGQFGNQRAVNVVGARETVEQSDWLADMDEEIDEHELEAHYSYMAKIQKFLMLDSGTA